MLCHIGQVGRFARACRWDNLCRPIAYPKLFATQSINLNNLVTPVQLREATKIRSLSTVPAAARGMEPSSISYLASLVGMQTQGLVLRHLNTCGYPQGTQAQAVAIDEELMGPLGFSVDQLMELAGLSVACSLADQYPVAQFKRVLVIAGPGNNGGDGLVCARHLHHWGYQVQVLYPKPTDKPLYNGLVTQLRALNIPLVDWATVQAGGPLSQQADVVVDAIFGFSFKGTPRPPFDDVLQALSPAAQPPPILSVDIPSGWDVEQGDVSGTGLRPDTLVSLTAPKLGVKSFQGSAHFLGGRFVPAPITHKYQLQLPAYPGAAQHVRLTAASAAADAAAQLSQKVADMRISYEKGGLLESDFSEYGNDPMQAWHAWFTEATINKVCTEPNAISLASVDPASGQPSVRVVLLKGYDDRGFVFYTNYNSRKGRELLTSGKASFCVYWEALQRQVRVEGVVSKVSEQESEEYFHSRPRGSQVGAWVSNQSQAIPNREVLENKAAGLMQQYAADESKPVPKPPHWGGFLIRPTLIEFWQGRPSRLHDRIAFTRETPDSIEWRLVRLQP